MSHPPGSARRSATSAAAALGVSSLVTGSLLLVASPAPADSDKQPGNSDAHAAAEHGRSTETPSPQGASTRQENTQAPADPAAADQAPADEAPAEQQGQRPPAPEHATGGQEEQQGAHGTSPQGDSGQSASHPSPENQAGQGAPTQTETGKSTEHNASPSGHEKSGKPSTDDRPGNQGTIKIDALDFDTHPNNEPHVGCMFQVDFYNYGMGDYDASVSFAQHPPTPGALDVASGSVTPYIGEDAPGGGTDLDAEETYRLDLSGDPHPKQGYHVKVTIHAPDSLGADTKHKVFWVQPCEQTQPPTGGESTPPPTQTTPPVDGDESVPPGGGGQTMPPGGGGQTMPPGGGGQTMPPGGGGQTMPPAPPAPPGEERTDAAPPLPGQPGAGDPQVRTGPQAGQAPGAQVVPPQRVRPGAAAGGGSVSGSAAAAAAPRAGVPTSVDAGLSGHEGADQTRTAATLLAGLGGLLLAAAGMLGRRRRGEHQP
jgi:hypothetical protein